MRRVIVLLVVILSRVSLFGQDTAFILKETVNGAYHAIFIDSNKNSTYYNRIASFGLNSSDSALYSESVKYLNEKYPGTFKKVNFDLPRQWVPLHYYQGKFYLYSPNDYMSNYLVGISDTTYIDYTGEGPVASRISSFTQMDSNTYEFSVVAWTQPDRTITIHILDKETGLAVFDDANAVVDPASHGYSVMVPAENIRQFPIIVNYGIQKFMEFRDFTEPDYKELLSEK
ncbi:MAG TPA: hypothetical protein VEC12_11975 [Bacteroidia bacterium]|nr:hypothetical protein [Bacteroidia bacterium]